MDLHQRQQFDFLLQTATERFAARLEERHRGAETALALLRSDPNAEGVWLDQFVEAIFADFLLDNADGAAFVLCAMPKRKLAGVTAGRQDAGTGTVEETLVALARCLLTELLLKKTTEVLEQHAGYQSV